MLRHSFLLVGVVALFVLVALQSAAAGPPSNVQCTGVFTGTTKDLTVPPNQSCSLNGAVITHDVLVQQNAQLSATNASIRRDLTAEHDASLFIGMNTVIGHDFSATAPQIIETGLDGPVSVGHDFTVNGSTPNGNYYDICTTSVKHSLQITNTTVVDELVVGDAGDICIPPVAGPDKAGHDLTVSNNVALFVDVGNNSVGHDLTVSDNKSTAYNDISDNIVGFRATCTGNTPPPSKDGPDDGPNFAPRNDGCG